MRRLCVVTFAALAAVPACAAAAAPVPERFGLTPAMVEVAGRPPATLPSVRVFNTTPYTYAVRAWGVRLSQAADGGLVPAPGRAGSKVGPASFRVAPHSSQVLRVRWTSLRRQERSGALGVIVRGRPLGRPAAGMRAIYRLIGTQLVRLPGPMQRGGSLTALDASQAGDRRLQITPAVHVTGKRYEFPRGTLRVRDSAGRTVARASFGGAVVLAGSTRPFPVLLDHRLKAGTYTLRAAARVAGHRSTLQRTLRLVPPGVLPTTQLALTQLHAHGQPGGEAFADAVVRNTGNVAAAGTVTVTIAGTRLRSATPRIAPGGSATVHLRGGHVGRNPVNVTDSVSAGGRTWAGPSTNLIPARVPDASHFPWAIVLALAGGVAIGAVARRRA